MRALLCFCSLWLILVCGAAYAEPEDEPIGSTSQAAATEPANPGAVAAIQKAHRRPYKRRRPRPPMPILPS